LEFLIQVGVVLSALDATPEQLSGDGMDNVLEECSAGLGLSPDDVYLAHIVPVTPADAPSENMAVVLKNPAGDDPLKISHFDLTPTRNNRSDDANDGACSQTECQTRGEISTIC